MSEQELIQSARQGDQEAIRLLYDRHSSQVYAVARRLTGDDALAEDCAQEAWIRALRGLPSYRGDAAFSTWIHRIAINSALGARRRHWQRQDRESPLQDTLPSPYPREAPLLRLRLERAMNELPKGMRQVMILHDVEGFTHQEIGEMLGIDPGTSKSQLFRARAKMRAHLKGQGHTTMQKVAS
jgi:RNA polymerase sigma-70 factor (ECF subfamily)